MCGFAGVVVWDEKFRVAPQTLRRMSAAVAHRGPDGEGLHLTREYEPITPDTPQVALAFRRLAILDPDPRSMQPFTDGRRWLVFNGEIYNFRELRAELKTLLPDYQWRTTGDTEVLLAAYAAWGEKCVEHLNGMFAFAVWDAAEKRLFLARDRMGQKPLYVCCVRRDGGFANHPLNCGDIAAIAFASELPAVLKIEWVSRETSPSELNAYLALGYIPWGSIYSSVVKLPPAAHLSAAAGLALAQQYFYGAWVPQERVDDATATQRTQALLRQAVARQLVSDVPLGCFLSGGIDSSIIAAAMRKSVPQGQPVLTFCAGFTDRWYDEREYAAAVAKHLGTTHHEFHARPDAASDLPKLAAVFGEPFGDSSALPTHYLSRETRQHVKVALSGDGGDELFGGYDRYRALALSQWLNRRPGLALAVRTAAMVLPGTHPKGRALRLRRLASSLRERPAQRYATYLQLFPCNLIAELLIDPPTGTLPHQWVARVMEKGCAYHDLVPAATATDRWYYLPGDLLTKVDRASMLHALEVRSPFMDHELVQFATGLTTDQLLRGGPKRMLREAFANDLPAWVFKRKKMGFAVPIGEWFRGELRPMLRDTLLASNSFGRSHFNMAVVQRLIDEHESRKVDHAQRLYALLMLELWWNTVRA